MTGKLPDELVARQAKLLKDISELVLEGIEPRRDVLLELMSKNGVNDAGESLQEILVWYRVLRDVRLNSNAKDNDVIIQSALNCLRERGLQEAPALFSIYAVVKKPFTCEPSKIDFGLLKFGDSATAIVNASAKVNGRSVKTNRLQVTTLEVSSDKTFIKIILTPGNAGETFRDEITIWNDENEIKIQVLAQWETAPQRLQICPICHKKGIHGEGSLFWNTYKKCFECFNCGCSGPTIDNLKKYHIR